MDKVTAALLGTIGLRVKDSNKQTPHIKVAIEGDYNDGDYITEETCYNVGDANDMMRLTELLSLLQAPYVYDCLQETPDCTSKNHCKGCPHSEEVELSDKELVDEIYDLVNLPRGPYGVCHTLTCMTIKYVDEDGCEVELEHNQGTDWPFPLHVGTDHY